jgi:hypothetical protein
MTAASLPCPLFAETLWERFSQGLSDEFQHRRFDAREILWGMAVVLGVAAVAWTCSMLLKMRDRYRIFHSPAHLFFVLCRAHRLQWRECWWLWRLARFQRLRDPARLFLEAERLDPEQLSPALRRRKNEVTQIRKRLFAETALKAGQAAATGDADRRQNAEKGTPRAAAVPLTAISADPLEPEADERVVGTRTPLLPAAMSPTLDLPPWNAASGSPLDA